MAAISFDEELRDLEAHLIRFSLRVREEREQRAPRPSEDLAEPPPFGVGDLVQTRVIGTGLVRGEIVAITEARIHIKPPGYTKPLQRAAKNVTLIKRYVRNTTATTTPTHSSGN
jgi:uncharacterized Fe-S cluster-containing radical SAM superfamily enzyme